MNEGKELYGIIKEIFSINRSITGNGVRETLLILKKYLPELQIYEVPTGTQVFDWIVPQEWNCQEAYIEDAEHRRILDFRENNLSIVNYSISVDKWVSLKELKSIIYTQPDQPELIPYVTSYYNRQYGFCMSEKQKENLKEGYYHIVINSSLNEGSLTYGEYVFQGQSREEIFISTYICHPSMANDNCSGIAVALKLAEWVKQQKNRYTYRFIFIPETIGAITYLSRNLEYLQKNMLAGFNLSCVGDTREYSYVPTRKGNTITDKVLQNILKYHTDGFVKYTYLDRGSDERQYNAPGVNLPVCCFCRSKFHVFPEYHTSADNLDFVSEDGLQGSFDVLQKCLLVLEWNKRYICTTLCEPQLGRRNLYPKVGQKGTYQNSDIYSDFLAYADGENDLVDIGDIIGISSYCLIDIVNVLLDFKLIKIV
ncbi:MAG: DUF4910 domain-containing protein [Lachnospiraceae bacterium]|jgi:aminopeptidase-like protein|nr:DUF4910 domain-containing protein [Lachnospiraceae bacterium]